MTLQAFLAGLQGPLVEAAVGVALFFVADWWPKFNAWAPRYKRLAMLVICMVIPVAACGLAILFGYQANNVEASWWPAIVAGATAFSVSQVAHGIKYLPTAAAA
jgi:hypothetical protein